MIYVLQHKSKSRTATSALLKRRAGRRDLEGVTPFAFCYQTVATMQN